MFCQDYQDSFLSGKDYYCQNNDPTSLGIQFEWDLDIFKHNLLWYVFNGDSGYPRYGDTYVLGFVPHNDKNRGLAKAEKHVDSPRIKAGETKKTWLKVKVLDK